MRNLTPDDRNRRNNSKRFELNRVIKEYSIIDVAKNLGLEVKNNCINCINPGHLDKNFSMELDASTNKFKCFGCGITGTNVDMVKLILEVTPYRAVDYITGKKPYPITFRKEYKKIKPSYAEKDENDNEQPIIQLTTQILNKVTSKSVPKEENIKIEKTPLSNLYDTGKIYKIYDRFLRLCSPIHKFKMGLGFLKDKEISIETLERMNIKYLDNYHNVDKQLRASFSEEDLVATGIFGTLSDEKGDKKIGLAFYYHKIIFPFINGNKILYMQGRRLNNEEPIYRNTGKTSSLIYNYDKLRKLKEGKKLIITNNIINTLALIDRQLHAIGLVGKYSIKKEWLNFLKPFKIVLSLDKKYESYENSIGKYLKANNINVFKIDIDELLNKPELINNVVPYSENKKKKEYDNIYLQDARSNEQQKNNK